MLIRLNRQRKTNVNFRADRNRNVNGNISSSFSRKSFMCSCYYGPNDLHSEPKSRSVCLRNFGINYTRQEPHAYSLKLLVFVIGLCICGI